MKTETAQTIAFIAKEVKIIWPISQRNNRLTVIHELLVCSNIPPITSSIWQKDELYIKTTHDEAVVLHIDGDLGVYYIQEGDEREPIRISLLNKRIVRKVTIEEIKVPSTGHETNAELFNLTEDYDYKTIEVTYNEIK